MLTCAKCGSQVALPADPKAMAASCPKCGSSVDLSSMRTMMDAPAPAPAAGDPLAAGKVLSGYRIEQVLGRGGMAVVYKAVQLSLSRAVALKVLPRHLSANPAFVARFTREAGALAALSHPNVIGIIDRGSEGDLYYFVMEFVDGTDLQAVLAQGRPAPAEAVRVLTQVLAALDYAHRRGVIHRDIKPGNIMISRDGSVKVTDFGIAHLAGGQGTAIGLTMAGAQMGTVNYMAPEQRIDAGRVDARADIYAAGVVLYEALTGQLPLGAFEPPSSLNPAVDPRLDAVVLRALKRDPAARFATAQDMAAALAPLASAAAPLPPAEPRPAETPAPPTQVPCPFCKSENRSDARFCLNCGKTLLETCPKCRRPMRVQAKFCDVCGTNVSEFLTKLKEDAAARFDDAVRHEKAGKLAEALAALDAVLAAEGKDLEALKEKAKVRREKVLAAKEKLDAAFRTGQEHYDRREFEAAVAAWEKLPGGLAHVRDALAEARRKIEARGQAVRAAEQAHGLAQWEEALSQWERAAALSTEPPPFREKLEEARAKAGEARYAEAARRAAGTADPASAAAAWSEALKWKPGDAAAQEGLRRAEEAKRLADRAGLVAQGDQAAAAGRTREAVDAWHKALALAGLDEPELKAALDRKLADGRARLAADRQKYLIVAVTGGGAFLVLIAIVVGLAILFGGDDDKKPASGTSAASSPGMSSPDELFEMSKRLIKSGDWDRFYGLHSRSYRENHSRQQFEQECRANFYPYNPNGANPDYMVRNWVDEQGNRASYYWAYPGFDGNYYPMPAPITMVKEDGGWKFD
ncbi:MAG: protein kinase [Planctomycetes bacterium]|nr:protein kinase [Planctomycetota bacterium]